MEEYKKLVLNSTSPTTLSQPKFLISGNLQVINIYNFTITKSVILLFFLLEMDPSYNVLQGDISGEDAEGGKSRNKIPKIIYYVVIPATVVVVVLILIAVIVVIPR